MANREWLDAAPDDIAATIEAVPLGGADGIFSSPQTSRPARRPSSSGSRSANPRLARRTATKQGDSPHAPGTPLIVQGAWARARKAS